MVAAPRGAAGGWLCVVSCVWRGVEIQNAPIGNRLDR